MARNPNIKRIGEVLETVYDNEPINIFGISKRLGLSWSVTRNTLVSIEHRCDRIKLYEDDEGNISVFRG